MDALPPEIIILILEKVKGTDIANCRRVCRRWCGIIDTFPDRVWETYCSRDFCSPVRHDIWSPQVARQHANLNYRELYKSLALWDRVEEADAVSMPMPVADDIDALDGYSIFNDLLGVVRTFVYYGDEDKESTFIDYYNLVSLELISTEYYSFAISEYYENAKLITLRDRRNRVHVIIKSKKHEIVYNASSLSMRLLSDTVYFINRNSKVCVVRLKVVDEEETIETTELAQILLRDYDSILEAYAPAGPNAVNIIFYEDSRFLRIYCVHDNICDEIEVDLTTPNIIAQLKEFGFNWTDPYIYRAIGYLTTTDNYEIATAQRNIVVRCAGLSAVRFHNEVLLMGTVHGDILIYKRAHNPNGDLNISYDRKPDRTITDIRALTRPIGNIAVVIEKIDVIEITNGHRIIALVLSETGGSYKVYFIDLLHNPQ